MYDSRRLYEVNEELAEAMDEAPTMIHLMDGFIDAGATGQIAAGHLESLFAIERLVTFDIDELLDYRSRRPMMEFKGNSWQSYRTPVLAIDLLRDSNGKAFLLLHGTEPDIRWEAWVKAVEEIVERFNVRVTVGLHGIPTGTPHTRPLGFTAHATRHELVDDYPVWFGEARIPSSASALMEYRLGQSGKDALGFAVHVPHYLTQTEYPQAAMVGLAQIEKITDLDLASGSLERAARRANEDIIRQVAEAPEIGALVRALEENYDEAAAALKGDLLEHLPTADEIGDELERFLSQQSEG